MICNPKKIKEENDIFTKLILISIYVFKLLLQFEKSYEDEWIFVYGHASKIVDLLLLFLLLYIWTILFWVWLEIGLEVMDLIVWFQFYILSERPVTINYFLIIWSLFIKSIWQQCFWSAWWNFYFWICLHLVSSNVRWLDYSSADKNNYWVIAGNVYYTCMHRHDYNYTLLATLSLRDLKIVEDYTYFVSQHR
jgi:hypothetical protein